MSKQKSPTTSDDLFIIGLDAEWETRDDRNFLLSFQWCVLFRGKKQVGIEYTHGVRPTLGSLLQTILSKSKQKELFQHYPKNVFLVAHYTPAEFHILADFHIRKSQVDLIQGSFTTLTKPMSVTITDTNRNQRRVAVHVRDTKLLTPEPSSLETLGKMHGIQKVALPPGSIERMSWLLANDKERFDEYAIRDAEISATHAKWAADQNNFLAGIPSIPHTLSSLAQGFCLNIWKSEEFGISEFFGEKPKGAKGTSRSGRHDKVSKYRYLALESFHGGRGEAFWFGPTPVTDLIDIDLVSAYSTALSTIGFPQWDEAVEVNSPDQFKADDLGFARIRFQFPEDSSHPCLPVRSEQDSLIFPLEGETYATKPDIECARDMGANIEVLDGVRIPTDMTTRPFENVVLKGQIIRKETEGSENPARARFYKTLINSLYGKTAQGLREKTSFDSRTGGTKTTPTSKLTQPYFAAHVTGLIRSAVSSAILRITQAGYRVYSVTTDGIITDAPEDAVHEAFSNPITHALRMARERLANSQQIVEIKHQLRQVVITTHQGTFTSDPGSGNNGVMLAKAGVKIPRGIASREDQNAWLLRRFFERGPKEVFQFEGLARLDDVFKGKKELVNISQEKVINLDYDMKRRPIDPRIEEIVGHGLHLAFPTSPWKSTDEFMAARSATQKWRARDKVLKTIDDFDSWEDQTASARLSAHGIRGTTSGGCVDAALRQFLRAFVRGEWGLQEYREKLSNKDAVAALQALGIDVREQDLKNAARTNAKLKPGAIPSTRRVHQLIHSLKSSFPNFQEEHMLSH